VVLSNENEILYSGECRIVSNTSGCRTREYVLEPTQDRIQRFERKQYRSIRQEIFPPPTVVFEHPLTGRLVSLNVLDLSGCGLAVEESQRSGVLMPGLMLPQLDLCLAGNVKFRCRAQVVYRRVMDCDSANSRLKCGLALLDIDVADHVQFVGLLHHASDQRSYLCNQVDMDELWSFFFETGFIYPEKYGFIHKNREQIKQTYETLYTRTPNIARHFVHQDRGRIVAHMAMIRFYDTTWLIHHHAALGNQTYRAGLNVLGQLGRFITDSHRFPFMNMEYVTCFYRPENHFPKRIFGGACQSIDDPKRCCETIFAYCRVRCDSKEDQGDLGDCRLSVAEADDLRELASFCQHDSSGLMLRALNLDPGASDQTGMIEEFRRLGLRRERSVYALKSDEQLQAILMVNLADIGLNLSDLTNCVTLFVLDHRGLTREAVHGAVVLLMKSLDQEQVPVLIYPEVAAECLKIPVEKRYVMWSLVPQFSDGFHRYTDAILRAGTKYGDSHAKRRPPSV